MKAKRADEPQFQRPRLGETPVPIYSGNSLAGIEPVPMTGQPDFDPERGERFNRAHASEAGAVGVAGAMMTESPEKEPV